MKNILQKGFSIIGLFVILAVVVSGSLGYFVYQEQIYQLLDPPDTSSEKILENTVPNETDTLPIQEPEEYKKVITKGAVIIKEYPSKEATQAFQNYYEERIKAEPRLKSEGGYLTVFNEFYLLHQNDPGIREYERWNKLEADYSAQWKTFQYPKGVSIDTVFVHRYDEKPLFDYSPDLTTKEREAIKKTLLCGDRSDVFWIDFSQPHLCEVIQINGKTAVYAIGILEQDKRERELGLPGKTILVNDVMILEDDHFVTARFNGIIPEHPLLGYAWPTETQGTVDFYLEFRPTESFWDVVKTQVSGYLAQPSEEIQEMMNTLRKSVTVILDKKR